MKRIKNKDNNNSLEFWNNFYHPNSVDKSSFAFFEERRVIYHKYILDKYLKYGTYSLLDIGCGTGHGPAFFKKWRPDYTVSGCDFSDTAIETAKKIYHDIDFFVFDIYNDTLSKIYDYITIIETLEHIENPYECIDKCLEKCSKLVISVPYKQTLREDKEHIITDITEKSFSRYNLLKILVWDKPKSNKKSYTKKYIVVVLGGKYYNTDKE